jgi:type IV fimbrial biogenesis protein FimT
LEQAVKIKSAKGFSLIELLVVIAIAAILLSIAVPNFNKYRDNSNLKEAARDISSDIFLFKQRAVSENRGYQINFSVAENKYRIYNETVLNSNTYDNLVIEKTVGAGNANIVIDSTTGFNSGAYITFNPRGTTNNCNSTGCAVKLKHSIRLSTATITTTLMGRVRDTYVLQ